MLQNIKQQTQSTRYTYMYYVFTDWLQVCIITK